MSLSSLGAVMSLFEESMLRRVIDSTELWNYRTRLLALNCDGVRLQYRLDWACQTVTEV